MESIDKVIVGISIVLLSLTIIKVPNKTLPQNDYTNKTHKEVISLEKKYLSRGNQEQVNVETIPYSLEEIKLIQKVVYAEARGEEFIGQVAVATVILNRVNSDEFPNTVKEVIYQKGQFSSVNRGFNSLVPDEVSYQATMEAIRGNTPIGKDILYFWNPQKANVKGVRVVKQIGNHVFGR